MSILNLIAADPSIDPAFAAYFDNEGTRAGRAARHAYVEACRKEGREPDPVMADEEFQRAKCRAEGRHYYSGD